MIEFVPALRDHARALAPRLRDADREEVKAQSGLAPGAALLASVAMGNATAALEDGVVIALFGCPRWSVLGEGGVPWMLGCNRVLEIPTVVLRHNKRFVEQWRSEFAYLSNHVDARNEVSIRWLRWLGFTIHDPAPHGPYGMAFHKFDWSR